MADDDLEEGTGPIKTRNPTGNEPPAIVSLILLFFL